MPAASPLASLLAENTMPSAPELARTQPDGRIRCVACGHRCLIADGKTGVCRVRFNRDGTLMVPAGYVAGIQLDPIEKKPFFHAFPGSEALSFGMLGCDLHCSYCQNWITSQSLRDDRAVARPQFTSPDELIALAREHQTPVIVSTYNEPLITADWAVEIFKLARAEGLTCGFISNGNATPEVLDFIRPWVDLYKVDLKGFDDRHYRELGGTLRAVLDTIRNLHRMGFWVEVVTLVVPDFNDGDEELRGIAEFLASVSTDIPWHITAFHPDYKMSDRGRTPHDTLFRAYDFGRAAGLKYIYPGNLGGRHDKRESTWCASCGELLIARNGFLVTANRLTHGRCPTCSTPLPGYALDRPQNTPRSRGFPLSLR